VSPGFAVASKPKAKLLRDSGAVTWTGTAALNPEITKPAWLDVPWNQLWPRGRLGVQ